MTPYKILVIDDEPQIHTFIRISLVAEGFTYLRCTIHRRGKTGDSTRFTAFIDIGFRFARWRRHGFGQPCTRHQQHADPHFDRSR